MNRRTFLKIAGTGSLTFAAGCTSEAEKTLYSLVKAPDDMVTGKARWYASTCRECPAGCGILAKNREGRVVKVEGNPLHPINKGKLCMRGQAALQGIYNPDRIKTPLLKSGNGWRKLSYADAEAMLTHKAKAAASRGRDKVRILTEVVGRSLVNLMKASLGRWNSAGPAVFEPFGYEFLKEANNRVFGLHGLLSYRMEQADFLLSFGADFLETWLSPVEYAGKFKEMHALKGRGKSLYFSVSPYQSLSCANADLALLCRPDTEYAVALGLLRESLRRGRGNGLPEAVRAAMERVSSTYTPDKVHQVSELPSGRFDQLVTHLHEARKPLILGTGTGGAGPQTLQTNMAVNLLNVLLDPQLTLFDFVNRHRVEMAAKQSEIIDFLTQLEDDAGGVLLLNNVNPVFALPGADRVMRGLKRDTLFVVSFSNFMDETTELADLILPVGLPLEIWDEYGGKTEIISTLQPAMGSLTGAPNLGDLLLRTSHGTDQPYKNYHDYVYARMREGGTIRERIDWLHILQRGGRFESQKPKVSSMKILPDTFEPAFTTPRIDKDVDLVLLAAPSIRFFDGRGANRPWLCEIPDPLSKVAWQSPVLMHPKTLAERGMKQGDLVQIQSRWGGLETPVYETESVMPGVAVISVGQGHASYGRYAAGIGVNPMALLPPQLEPASGGPYFTTGPVLLRKSGDFIKLAHTDGSRLQHDRKIALTVSVGALDRGEVHKNKGLGMWDFPFTMPLPGGYDERRRDFYPPHEHKDYRWAMVVDLDRCIGCAACAAACYAENNLAVVKERHIIEGREMAWLQVQRYEHPEDRQKLIFLPMLCQHCDDAPCESVCPVFAPHHNKEGINNQIYNRCIGTRFCSQDCPYKVRRFNWFDWQWPEPLNLQLNPDVTARGKGVMEKCSFCIQRIKDAHDVAKNENRKILDGEIQPACMQTCPTRVFTFGNLMDTQSEVRKKVADKRAYQVMGYLNTKPAVIYMKKVVQEI